MKNGGAWHGIRAARWHRAAAGRVNVCVYVHADAAVVVESHAKCRQETDAFLSAANTISVGKGGLDGNRGSYLLVYSVVGRVEREHVGLVYKLHAYTIDCHASRVHIYKLHAYTIDCHVSRIPACLALQYRYQRFDCSPCLLLPSCMNIQS